MAIFIYKGKDKQSVERSGEIESSDPRSAASILRKRGLIVVSVKVKEIPFGSGIESIFNKVSFSDLVRFTRQLATMIGAGLVLSEALDILDEQEENKKLKKALGEISDAVKGGMTLAQSFSRHPEIFPAIYVNLVKSGEASGKLDQVLLKMADNLEKEREFRARIKGALIYPMVVIIMMVAVIVLMITFVIPRLTALYTDAQIDLPLPTKILIAVSSFFTTFWWALLIALAAGIYGLRRWGKTQEGKLVLDKLLLKMPIVGKIITSVTLTNFTRTFGLLVSAGIPLLEAINIVSDITDNSVFKRSLKESYIGVERGLPFSTLLPSPLFPRIVGQMVKVGEETGKVDEIFFKLSDYFESEADHMVKNLTVAIEPIILIILGIGVGFLVISIILPIYKLTTSF
ncbi:MAG: type II secretion system F family protein [Candidatus Daviesbacteria bacterium]|nr:type II secretion system F family protein [Candidatus Daviesbacteria bacterium]